jgi:acetamidase/formamidase
VRIDELRPRPWGVTFGDGEAFEWRIDTDAGTATSERGVTVSIQPFLGVIGMPADEGGVWRTAPPRRWGGNIDCKLLVAGSTLFLPISNDGALLSLGDGHAAQGDGEVSGTAIECPLEAAQVTIDVRDDLELRMPMARTAGAWLAFGFDEDLDVAAGLATETMLDLIERELGRDRKEALALASIAVDLAVTQVVNGTKGVHAILRDGALAFAAR